MNTIQILRNIYSRCLQRVLTPTIVGLSKTIIGLNKVCKILLLDDIIIATKQNCLSIFLSFLCLHQSMKSRQCSFEYCFILSCLETLLKAGVSTHSADGAVITESKQRQDSSGTVMICTIMEAIDNVVSHRNYMYIINSNFIFYCIHFIIQ